MSIFIAIVFRIMSATKDTSAQYDQAIQKCVDLFKKKTHDYGTAWRILRPSSLTDQIFIKAQRIRTIEEKGESKVGEGIEDEFVGIINYSLMALIQLELPSDAPLELQAENAIALYTEQAQITKELMMNKNHDYGEAWREMRVSSFTDLILMKILRIKQIEDNSGKTLVSEGIDSGFRDMINVFNYLLKTTNHCEFPKLFCVLLSKSDLE